MKIEMKRLSLACDRDYGIDNRTGWTICEDGCVIVELERRLIIAIIKLFSLKLKGGH